VKSNSTALPFSLNRSFMSFPMYFKSHAVKPRPDVRDRRFADRQALTERGFDRRPIRLHQEVSAKSGKLVGQDRAIGRGGPPTAVEKIARQGLGVGPAAGGDVERLVETVRMESNAGV
jgi:hypothetical protein